MISQENKDKLYILAKKCLSIRNSLVLGTSVLTPVNYTQERDKFFKSKIYNPVFSYNTRFNPLTFAEINHLYSELDDIKLPRELKEYLFNYFDDLKTLAKTVDSLGTEFFPYYSKKLFNYHTTIARQAKNVFPIINFEEKKNEEMYDATQIAEAFKTTLIDTYHIPNVEIKIDSFNDHTIRVGKKRIIIGSGVRRYKKNVERLIVHEIESHVLQSMNIYSKNNPLQKISGYADTLLYGEGIAVYNEFYTGTITREAYDTYYYRLKAVERLNKPFREIYDYLSSHLPSKKAFVMTYRVKRGMKDTKQPGGFHKDALYLLGYKTIHDYISQGSRLDFIFLSKNPELTSLMLRYNLIEATDVIMPKFLLKKKRPKPALRGSTLIEAKSRKKGGVRPLQTA